MPAPKSVAELQAISVLQVNPRDATDIPGFQLKDESGVLISDSNALVVNNKTTPIAADAYFNKYLRNAGNNDMGIDGSAAEVSFSAGPPAGKNLELARLMVYMEASANFASTNFMNLAALANGVQFKVGGLEISKWQDNIDAAVDMFDLSNAGTAFSNERRSLTGRFTFTRGTAGEPLLVEDGKTFEAVVRDDLSAAGIIFRVKIQGQLVDS